MNLNHVFYVSFKSCKPESGRRWIYRLTVKQSNACKSSPFVLAGNIAAHHMRLTETGVRVEYIGLQENRGPVDGVEAPITELSPFTLTIERKSNET